MGPLFDHLPDSGHAVCVILQLVFDYCCDAGSDRLDEDSGSYLSISCE